MDRRGLLRRLGAGALLGAGGCLDRPGASSTSSTTVAAGRQRRVAVADRDAVADEYGVDVAATVRDPAVTGADTATVAVTTTNRGDPRRLSVSTGACAILNRADCASSPAGVWLRRRSARSGTTASGPKWVADDLPDGAGGFGGYGCPRERFASGEAVTSEYAVLHDGRVDGYLAPGEYRFETTVRVWPAATRESPSSPSASFDWGFSLEVVDAD